MSEIENLAATLHRVAKPDMKPKELVAAVREQHPKATKKEIVRAAFYALTQAPETNADKARHLHAFALTERTDEEEAVPLPKRLRKKDRRKESEARRDVH